MSPERTDAYFIGGVNGVGKSSLLREIAAHYPQFEIFRGSARLMQQLGLSMDDYSALRRLPDNLKNTATHAMMHTVLSERSITDPPLLVDAHYFNYKGGELIDVTGDWMSRFKGLFVVSAHPATILRRLELDEKLTGRIRDVLPAGISEAQKTEILAKFLEQTEAKAQQLSQRYQIPYFVIDNNAKGLDIATEQYIRYYSAISSIGN